MHEEGVDEAEFHNGSLEEGDAGGEVDVRPHALGGPKVEELEIQHGEVGRKGSGWKNRSGYCGLGLGAG